MRQEIDGLAKFHDSSNPFNDLLKDKGNELLLGLNPFQQIDLKQTTPTAQSVKPSEVAAPPSNNGQDPTVKANFLVAKLNSNQNMEPAFSGMGIGSNETLFKSNQPAPKPSVVAISQSQDTLTKKPSFSNASDGGSPPTQHQQISVMPESREATEVSEVVLNLRGDRRGSLLKPTATALTSWSEQSISDPLIRRRRSSVAAEIVKDPRKHLPDVTKTLIDLSLDALERLMRNILRNITEPPRVILPDPLDANFAKEMELTSKLVVKLSKESVGPIVMSSQDASTLLSQVIQNHRPLFPRHLISLIQSRAVSYISMEDMTQYMRPSSYLMWLMIVRHFQEFEYDAQLVAEWLADECQIFPRHLYEASFVDYRDVLRDLDSHINESVDDENENDGDALALRVGKAILCPDNVLLHAFLKLDNAVTETDVNEMRGVAESLVCLYDNTGDISFLISQSLSRRLSTLQSQSHTSNDNNTLMGIDDILPPDSLTTMIIETYLQESCGRFISDRKTIKRIISALTSSNSNNTGAGAWEYETDPMKIPVGESKSWPIPVIPTIIRRLSTIIITSAHPSQSVPHSGQHSTERKEGDERRTGNRRQSLNNLLALSEMCHRLLDTLTRNIESGKASQALFVTIGLVRAALSQSGGRGNNNSNQSGNGNGNGGEEGGVYMKLMVDCLLIPGMKQEIGHLLHLQYEQQKEQQQKEKNEFGDIGGNGNEWEMKRDRALRCVDIIHALLSRSLIHPLHQSQSQNPPSSILETIIEQHNLNDDKQPSQITEIQEIMEKELTILRKRSDKLSKRIQAFFDKHSGVGDDMDLLLSRRITINPKNENGKEENERQIKESSRFLKCVIMKRRRTTFAFSLPQNNNINTKNNRSKNSRSKNSRSSPLVEFVKSSISQ